MSILHSWVEALPIRMQGTLLVASRGYDGPANDGYVKRIVRALRGVGMRPADPREEAQAFLNGTTSLGINAAFVLGFKPDVLDYYSVHYVAHLMHATEIVGYYHPDEETRNVWYGLYLKLCNWLHVMPEPVECCYARMTEDRITGTASAGIGEEANMHAASFLHDAELAEYVRNIHHGV